MCAYEELVRRLPGGAQDAMDWDGAMHGPVSYTHLTLPTKRIV